MNTSTETRTTPLTDLALAFYAAVLTEDSAAASVLAHPDLVLHVPGTHPLAGEHHGIAGFLAFTSATRALTTNGQQMELLDVMEGASHVAAYVRVGAEREGYAPLDNLTIHLVRFEDGLVRDIRFHNWDDVAVSAFWS